jgi:hypothetical protein
MDGSRVGESGENSRCENYVSTRIISLRGTDDSHAIATTRTVRNSYAHYFQLLELDEKRASHSRRSCERYQVYRGIRRNVAVENASRTASKDKFENVQRVSFR